MYIYKITNIINGKIYVGKCKRAIDKSMLYFGSGLLIKRAILKHGKENFNKLILETCHTVDELNARETHWITTLNSTDRRIGYNIGTGGEGNDNFTFNPNKELIREKFSNAQRGKKQSSQHIQNQVIKNIGKKRTIEQKNTNARICARIL